VIGPKDLPKALKTVGIWVRKAREISGEFRSSVDQMVREAELDEVRQQVKKAAELDLDKEFRETVDPTGSLAESLRPPELDLDAPAPKKAAEPPPAIEAPPAPEAGAPEAGAPEAPIPETPAIETPPRAARG
jgi:sec-independent protein translocase protein TatB